MNKKNISKLIFLLFLFSVTVNAYSESVYTLDLKKDIILSTVSLGAIALPYAIEKELVSPGPLDKNSVNAFDRPFMYHFDENLNTVRDVVVFAFLPFPFITPLAMWIQGGAKFNMQEFDTWFTYGVMYCQAAALTWGTRTLIKNLVDRHRPGTYLTGGGDYFVEAASFPSGSTATAFFPATFLSVTFASEYPDSKWKIPVIAGSYAVAAYVGINRIISGGHFLSDVLVGAAIGSFYGWLIPTVHRKTKDNERLSFFFTGDGIIVKVGIRN